MKNLPTNYPAIFLSILLILLYTGQISGQQAWSATVVDAATGTPVPFASIGFINQPIGVIADKEGNFSMVLPEDLLANTRVRISSISYKDKEFTLDSILKLPEQVLLQPQSHALQMVTVNASAFGPPEVFGKDKTPKNVTFYFQSNQLGTQLGEALWPEKKDRLVHGLNFYLMKNEVGAIAFRAHLYELQTLPNDSLVFRELLDSNYVIRTEEHQGWLHVDLRGGGYIIPAGVTCVVALEWLEDHSGRARASAIQFGAYLNRRGHIYSRQATQDRWAFFPKRYYGLQTRLAFNLEASLASSIDKK